MTHRFADSARTGRTLAPRVDTVEDLPKVAPENEWRWVGPRPTDPNPGQWYKFGWRTGWIQAFQPNCREPAE